MNCNWTTHSIEELSTKVTDGAHHSPPAFSNGIPMFSVKDMLENGFNYDNAKTISDSDYSNLINSGCQPEVGDILIAKDGSVLKHIFVVKNKPDYVLLSSIAIIRPNKSLVFPDFLAYTIKSPQSKENILNNFVGGSGVPRIVLKDFKQIKISLPPLPIQKAIAEVLSCLDDKIDLLHRQNKTLEQMAETLFRQWFVEEANEDWEEKPLSEIADFLNGLACQKFPPKNEIDKLPVLKIKELKEGFNENSDWARSDVDEKYIIKSGDIIFSWSASLVVKIWNGEKCILNQHLFKVSSEIFPKWFYYLWCQHHLNKFISIATAHATTMGHIKRSDLDLAFVNIPAKTEMASMNKSFEPLINKIIANNKQIKQLENMRYILLPNLLNGDVKLNDL